MSIAGSGQSHSFARRKPPPRIIIARGETVRTFILRPWMVGTIATAAMLFGTLYLAATGYLFFRDDLLTASIVRHARMQHAYEDRIAALRADIDRLTSRQLLNQEAVEAEVNRLLGKQAALDARQDIIAGLSQAVRRAGLAPKADGDSESVTAAETPKTKLKTSSLEPVPGARAKLAEAALRSDRSGGEEPLIAGAPAKMDKIEESLDALARDQVAYVDNIAATIADRGDKIAAVLEQLGHLPSSERAGADVGGPFIPLAEDADPETFRSGVALITGEIERLTTIRRFAAQLPLAKPIANSAVTSRFGARIDPFLRRPAMHAGIDFRASTGYPARATAGGTVITAGYSGGYGKMVEIDHGHGVTTRYGHLSRVLVTVGEVVSKGTIIGRAGSTGRSTGPHLHYEVRIDGAAIDPMSYIRAGNEIAPLL